VLAQQVILEQIVKHRPTVLLAQMVWPVKIEDNHKVQQVLAAVNACLDILELIVRSLMHVSMEQMVRYVRIAAHQLD